MSDHDLRAAVYAVSVTAFLFLLLGTLRAFMLAVTTEFAEDYRRRPVAAYVALVLLILTLATGVGFCAFLSLGALGLLDGL